MTSKQIETVLKRYGIKASYKRYSIPYHKYKSKITNEEKTVQEYLFDIRKYIPKQELFIMPSRTKAVKLQVKRAKYLKSPLNYIGGL